MAKRTLGYFKSPSHWTLAQKLEHYSDRSGGPDSCWNWTAALAGRKTEGRYGAIHWNNKQYRAHRVMWETVNGPIPPGLHACHKCDNTKCINPAHIFLGTDADNHADKEAKGRGLAGRNRPELCSLTDEQVRAIRNDKRKRDIVGAEYGISGAHVSNIRLRRRRQHVPDLTY